MNGQITMVGIYIIGRKRLGLDIQLLLEPSRSLKFHLCATSNISDQKSIASASCQLMITHRCAM